MTIEYNTIQDFDLEGVLAPFDEVDDVKDIRTHIVNPPANTHIWEPGMTTKEMVVLARMSGIAIVALCGYRWVPKNNPDNFPLCDECMKIGMEMLSE